MKNFNKILKSFIAYFVLIFFISSCYKEVYVEVDLEGWTTESHSNDVAPNYEMVFDQTKVNRIDIVLTEDEYSAMQNDLADILGSSSSGGGPGGGGPGGGGQGGQTFSEETPVYMPADFYFNGIQWYDVGVRYKGNSSLTSSYSSGIGKLPLRFNFDYFEESNIFITDQRFYGFKELSMSSNFNDKSFLREKTGADIFREFGVPAPRTAFYEVYMDYGEGAEYLGLYTMVEVVFDSMLEDYFGSNTGNCYKPDGDGAKFSSSDFDLDDFGKKTNEQVGDWSDIQEMYDALHASNRTSDVEAWKSTLESVFDVDGFLKYLAVNNTIQNWDTYGNMTHNYYLYHDPADDLIKWIVWDNNEAFQEGNMTGSLSFEMNEVGSEWPLISYIIAIPEYREIYDDYIREFIDSSFLPSKMESQYSAYDQLISSSASSEISNNTFLNDPSDYSAAVSTIKSHCYSRYTSAENYLTE